MKKLVLILAVLGLLGGLEQVLFASNVPRVEGHQPWTPTELILLSIPEGPAPSPVAPGDIYRFGVPSFVGTWRALTGYDPWKLAKIGPFHVPPYAAPRFPGFGGTNHQANKGGFGGGSVETLEVPEPVMVEGESNLVSVTASDIGIKLYAPWQSGMMAVVGGDGYWYGQGYHTGADYYAMDINLKTASCAQIDDEGYPILAACDGVITDIHHSGSYGWTLIMQSSEDGSYKVRYAHLQGNPVTTSGVWVGKTLCHGEEIGKLGNTGWSDGAHLHFVVYRNGGAAKPSPMSGYNLYDGLCMMSDNVPCSSPSTGPYVTIHVPTDGAHIVDLAHFVTTMFSIESSKGIREIWFGWDCPAGSFTAFYYDAGGATYYARDDIVFDWSTLGYDDVDYTIWCRAKDADGKETTATITVYKNTDPPGIATNVQLISGIDSLILNWDAYTTPDIREIVISYRKSIDDPFTEVIVPATASSWILSGWVDYHAWIQVMIQAVDHDGHRSYYGGGMWGGKQASATWHPNSSLLRLPDGRLVTIEWGRIYLYPTERHLLADGRDPGRAINISADEASRFPIGGNKPLAQATAFILTDDSKMYVVDEGKIRLIETGFPGYNPSDMLEFSLAEVDMPYGSPLMLGDSFPEGTFFSYGPSWTLELVSGPFQAFIFDDSGVMDTHKNIYPWPFLIVDSATADLYTLIGWPRVRDGNLVQLIGDPAYYWSEFSQLRHIWPDAHAAMAHGHDCVIQLSPAAFGREIIGNPITSGSISDSRLLVKHPDGTWVINKGTVGRIMDGKLYLVNLSKILEFYGVTIDDCVPISDAEWNYYPVGGFCLLRPGTLIDISGEISVVGYDGVYTPFGSLPALENNGHQVTDAIPLSAGDVSTLTANGQLIRDSRSIDSSPVHVPGELVTVSGTMFLLGEAGQYGSLRNMDCFDAHRFNMDLVKEVPAAWLTANYTDGGYLPFAEGRLLQGTGPEVYLLIGGQKCVFMGDVPFIGMGYQHSMVLSIDNTVLMAIPDGPPIEEFVQGLY